ncbi:hypothetical protein NXS19_000170 [Fusarium pseudograminearum]|nr:hypothetical protein NXS19_000170 [Fusarium pseudograminearum]
MSEQRLFACERCSRRKQRCDRTIPVCQPCQEAQAECTGSASEGTVISGNDRIIARKGPVTRLLEQIQALEEKLRGHDRGEAGSGNASAAAVEHDRRLSPDAAAGPSEHQDNPSMNMRFLSLSAMAEPPSRRGEFLKHLSTPRLIAGITKTYGADMNKALEIYLAVVDFRFPRLAVDKVLVGIGAISHPEEDHFRRIVATDPAHVFMAYAVIAIVPLVSDAYPISQGSWVAVHVLGKCMELLDRVFNQEDGIDIIQCLQLLVILAVHCSAAGSAWHLSSFAMNKCIALGYHREDLKSASVSLLDVQQRRWAFWGCYFLDVLICAALDRPPSIDVRHITTPLPDSASNSPSQCAQHGQIILHLRTSPSATHRLIARDVYHKQLFQYARILSQIISDINIEESRMKRLKIAQICAAVARSLDRVHMAGRSYLSLITGYSSLTMAFACLYLMAVRTIVRNRVGENTTWHASQSHLGSDASSMRWHTPPPSAPFQNSADTVTSYAPNSSRSYHLSPEGEAWADGLEVGGVDDAFHMAIAKVDVVGRQFPRLNHYGRMALDIRKLLISMSSPASFFSSAEVIGDQLGAIKDGAQDTGPMYLRQLTAAILCIISQAGPN